MFHPSVIRISGSLSFICCWNLYSWTFHARNLVSCPTPAAISFPPVEHNMQFSLSQPPTLRGFAFRSLVILFPPLIVIFTWIFIAYFLHLWSQKASSQGACKQWCPCPFTRPLASLGSGWLLTLLLQVSPLPIIWICREASFQNPPHYTPHPLVCLDKGWDITEKRQQVN